MATMSNITVFDGAATPVSHTLVPQSVSKEKTKVTAIWREIVSTVPVDAQISLTLSLELLPSGTYVCTTDVRVPVMEAIAGNNAAGYTAAPKVAFIDRRVSTQYVSPRSTVASRRLARQLDINFQGNVTTTVAPDTTGFASVLFDLLVMPN